MTKEDDAAVAEAENDGRELVEWLKAKFPDNSERTVMAFGSAALLLWRLAPRGGWYRRALERSLSVVSLKIQLWKERGR